MYTLYWSKLKYFEIITENTFMSVAFTIGKGVVAGGAVLGIGSLCYYGLGLSPSMGAIDYAKYFL